MIEEFRRSICSMRHGVIAIMHHVVGGCFIFSTQQDSYTGNFENRSAGIAIGRVYSQVVWLAREVAINMTSIFVPFRLNGHTGIGAMSK